MTGDVPSGSPPDEHARECPECADLLLNQAALARRLGSAACEPTQDSDAQLAAVELSISRERGLRAFLRSRSTRTRWALSLALPMILLARELIRRRVPVYLLTAPRLLGGILLLGLLALVIRVALRPLPIARSAARLRTALAWVAWCLPFVLWFAPAAPANGEELAASGFALRSLACFAYGSALSLPSFVLLWAMDRGEIVPFRVWALSAGVVGLVANLILLLHCPVTHEAHLVAGHFSIGLIWFLALAAREWGRRRAVPE